MRAKCRIWGNYFTWQNYNSPITQAQVKSTIIVRIATHMYSMICLGFNLEVLVVFVPILLLF